MIDLLLEKYLDSVKQYRHVYHIFVNPSMKEMRDLKSDSSMGMRFVINNNTKKFYIWNSSVIHSDAFKNSDQLRKGFPKFNHDNYWGNGEGASYVFTGTIYQNDIESDTWEMDFENVNYSERFLQEVETFIDSDISWAKKYVNVDKIKDIAQKALDNISQSRF